MKAKKGFTLVEILIVVVILGILAAIVIPQFTDASTDAKTSSVKSNLQMLRSQIELYKINNNDAPPTNLDALVTDKYIQQVPAEAFGADWSYTADANGYTLSSPTTTPVDCTGF